MTVWTFFPHLIWHPAYRTSLQHILFSAWLCESCEDRGQKQNRFSFNVCGYIHDEDTYVLTRPKGTGDGGAGNRGCMSTCWHHASAVPRKRGFMCKVEGDGYNPKKLFRVCWAFVLVYIWTCLTKVRVVAVSVADNF